MRNFYQEGPEDIRHINKWFANMFGDYYTRKGLSVAHREMITFASLRLKVAVKLNSRLM